MLWHCPKNMIQLESRYRNSGIYFISILLFIIFIPSPAQGLCTNSESCGILGGLFLSMLTVPLCLIALIFAIWPKTRRTLLGFAILPGLMTMLTMYLIVIQAKRIDLIYIPLIHLVLMAVMIGLGRFNPLKESENIEA